MGEFVESVINYVGKLLSAVRPSRVVKGTKFSCSEDSVCEEENLLP